MRNEEFIAQNLCNDCNDKATCSVSCYWFDNMKRLAEWKDEQFAAEEYAIKHKAKYLPEDCYSSEHEEGFLAGAKFGYNEAIKMAKEWLKRHIGDFHPEMDDLYLVSDSNEIYFDGDELLTDFETDMNKLWEEKKCNQ